MALYTLDDRSPRLPPEGRYWIAPSADVMGDVTLGDEASVWFHAVLRCDNEPMVVGARSNIQDGAVLHSDPGKPLIIGEDCTIGHNAILHGCRIGDGSLIGMGATVLNGAVVGRGCLVGANTLITEGKTFADHSLIVGSPARAIRALDDGAVAGLLRSAAHYVANWKRFAAGLTATRHERPFGVGER